VLESPGEPLAPAARAFFEPRFGHSFADVRVHRGPLASASARDIGAMAYTVGSQVVVDDAHYDASGEGGRRLLAHELTHVLQQKGAAPTGSAQAAVTPVASVAPKVQRTPNFDADCSGWHRCIIEDAIANAKLLADDAIRELGPVAAGSVISGRIVDLLNVHFHVPSQPQIQEIKTNFEAVSRELDGSLRHICHPSGDECASTTGRFTGAFTTCTAGADVGYCGPFFLEGCEDAARKLLHEYVHHLGFCSDPAYVDQAGYMTLPTPVAMRNADTYAQFALMVHMGGLRCRECQSVGYREDQRRRRRQRRRESGAPAQ
jgi:hypothetical protein